MLHSCSLQFHGNLIFNKNRQGGDRLDLVIKDGQIFWKGGFPQGLFFPDWIYSDNLDGFQLLR